MLYNCMETKAQRELEKRIENNPYLQGMIQRGKKLLVQGEKDAEAEAARAEADDAERELKNKERREKAALDKGRAERELITQKRSAKQSRQRRKAAALDTASTELIRGARLALAERVLAEMNKAQAKEEVRKHTGAPRRSKSGHIIGGTYSHFKDLPRQVRRTLSPTDAFFATDVKETPEQNKRRRRGALSKRRKEALSKR